MQFMEVPHTRRRYYLLRYKKLCSIITTGALIASSVAAAFGADYKTSIKLVLSGGQASTEMIYDEEYTLTIPESLTITTEGWNSIGSMTANYGGKNDGFDPEKKLLVIVASTTDFKLVADGISDKIGYTVRTSKSDTKATTTFEFTAEEINTSGGTSKAIGVSVGSFTGKSNATYSDTIIYSVSVESAVTEIELSNITGDYTAQNHDVLTGLAGSDVHITVPDGVTIRLKEATINTIPNDEEHKWAGITCDGTATIILEGDNEVKGGHEYYPGIFIAPNATLTIKGSGSLTASSNGKGAGIGGGYQIACGNIRISGGTVNAKVDEDVMYPEYAAGIGGGYQASCGNITITNGVTSVTASKGEGAPHSIGAGDGGTCGTVTIGGTVYWDGSSYQNGGGSVITQSPYTYTPTNG